MQGPAKQHGRLSRRQAILGATVLVAMAFLTGATFLVFLPISKAYILVPLLATVAVYLVFTTLLKRQVGNNIFGELGFLYLSLALAYTVLPAFGFMVVDLSLASGWVSSKLAPLLPAPVDLGIHLWRHFLFVVGTAVGYIACRGKKVPVFSPPKNEGIIDSRTILVLVAIVIVVILCLNLLSSPVTTYIDNYTRYDHLSWIPRKFVSLCVRLKMGIYTVLIAFLFRNYGKFKLVIPFVVAGICIHEMIYSFGARIDSLILLLETVCLYHYTVRQVTLKQGLVACLSLGLLFTGIEVVRQTNFNVSAAEVAVSDEGVKPASEFGAVYFTSYHLYSLRSQGALPERPWQMFFFDFIAPVTWGEFTEWNPQFWYARNFFPEAVVPPETMGPIAESAMWGGEVDLLLRSIINGAFFAYIMRWFIHRKEKWWALVVFVYCYATCVMTLKYSVFYHLAPLVKTIIPTMLMVEIIRRCIRPQSSRTCDLKEVRL